MTTRYVLAAIAVLVLGFGVYLLLEVRAKPAEALASGVRTVASKDAPPPDEPEPPPEEAAPPRARPKTTTPRRPPARKLANRLGFVRRTVSAPAAGAPDREQDGKPYRLDQIMDEANRAYDRMDLDEAREIAQRVLAKQPENVRMLRIMVSAACIEYEPEDAQKYFNLLPARDRAQMKTRCMRYGVTFTDPPPR